MWGARQNGKNHHWSMGYHWLVALLVLPATLMAEFTSTDSDNLAHLAYYFRRDMGDQMFWIRRTGDAVFELQSEVQKITDSDFIPSVLEGEKAQISITDYITNFLNLARVDYPGSSVVSSSALRVTSPDLNARLDVVIGLLSNLNSGASVYIPLDGNFFYGSNITSSQVLNQMDAYLRLMYAYYDSLLSGSPSSELLDQYDDILLRYGTWKWEAMSTLFSINPKFLYGDSSDTNIFGRVWQSYLDSFGIATSVRFLRAYNETYFNQYSTLPVYLLQSNFLYSAVNNGKTNQQVLAQLLSNDGIRALIQNEAFSNSLSSVVSEMVSKQGVNTNDVYIGSYGTNSTDLADIVTNGYDAISGNSSYVEYKDSISSSFFSNKVSRFNFSDEFDASLRPFLDEISQDDGGDWVVEFGNVTLDDFSFTIPSVTVQHNETYLGFIDQTLNVLKVFSSFCFFLVLWREVGKAAAT